MTISKLMRPREFWGVEVWGPSSVPPTRTEPIDRQAAHMKRQRTASTDSSLCDATYHSFLSYLASLISHRTVTTDDEAIGPYSIAFRGREAEARRAPMQGKSRVSVRPGARSLGSVRPVGLLGIAEILPTNKSSKKIQF